jgi:hypothetical protein
MSRLGEVQRMLDRWIDGWNGILSKGGDGKSGGGEHTFWYACGRFSCAFSPSLGDVDTMGGRMGV